VDSAQQDDNTADKVRASIYEWRESKKRAKYFEQKANGNPRFYASSAFYFIRGTRRHLRRLVRKRFGVKVRYFGLRSKQYIASRKRFPYYRPRSPQDNDDYVQFSVMSGLLRVHDALWAAMHSAYIRAHRNGEDPDVAALAALFKLLGSGPWAATPTNRAEPDDILREISAVTVAGWAGAHISLRSENRDQRVEAALSENTDGSPGANFARLLEELVPATLIAWDEVQPGEPLRPGSGKTNLVSRVEGLLGKLGSEGAEKQKPHEEFAEVTVDGRNDPLLEEFERMETVRQMEAAAGLSPGESAVWQRVRSGMEITEIAQELQITKGNVSVKKHNAFKKLDEARRASGL
jgi:DNA-binding CsgD family transcriptional regulator